MRHGILCEQEEIRKEENRKWHQGHFSLRLEVIEFGFFHFNNLIAHFGFTTPKILPSDVKAGPNYNLIEGHASLVKVLQDRFGLIFGDDCR
jgi:hypothetical protein